MPQRNEQREKRLVELIEATYKTIMMMKREFVRTYTIK